mmetsp:Transcript_125359/g.250219  ORF Transcript_125359/g.250219 Transcript_125359/m.250219 type:complete len:241 (+) Transcript_125359:57-779(+)
MTDNQGDTSVCFSAWMQTNTPFNGQTWASEWCVLHKDALLFYVDEASMHQGSVRGQVQLQECSRIYAMSDPEVHGKATEVCQDHPSAFILDVDSSLSLEGQYFFLDSDDADRMEDFVSSFRKAINMLSDAEAFPKKGVSENQIDDFSDYEDTSHEQRSSFVQCHQTDWTNPDALMERKKRPSRSKKAASTYEIDDFSDYDDDEVAKRSSLAASHDIDWDKVNDDAEAEEKTGEVDLNETF